MNKYKADYEYDQGNFFTGLSTNQMWACFFTTRKINLSNYQQPILQLVDNYTSRKVTFPLYTDFPDTIPKISALTSSFQTSWKWEQVEGFD